MNQGTRVGSLRDLEQQGVERKCAKKDGICLQWKSRPSGTTFLVRSRQQTVATKKIQDSELSGRICELTSTRVRFVTCSSSFKFKSKLHSSKFLHHHQQNGDRSSKRRTDWTITVLVRRMRTILDEAGPWIRTVHIHVSPHSSHRPSHGQHRRDFIGVPGHGTCTLHTFQSYWTTF